MNLQLLEHLFKTIVQKLKMQLIEIENRKYMKTGNGDRW
ncbi:hypothetical protein PaelaDRAFT_1166 [Paenibacillus lactis 154]|uniref:Uncharacterized protein n=1 Tax=Paenibacillus lactis 154 TaxID=743719 RepID=G4HAI3_9BACL|nr:hypothetical protein PaelaDRAFT_1166 [Paenibacillus lactis 154]